MNNAAGERVALVTGAASGLGHAVSQRLVAGGCRLHLLDRDENGLARATESMGMPERITCSPLDVRDPSACETAVSDCERHHGGVDILVNCAGIYPRAAIMDIDVDQWRDMLDINVLGTYFMMVAASRAMKRRGGGRMVNISSIDAFKAHPDNAHYAASKAAVVSLTRSFAIAVAGDGITVNSVAPGPIATERALESDWYDDAVQALPTRHAIEPEEIARIVEFLVRPENHSITGENLIASGGGVIA